MFLRQTTKPPNCLIEGGLVAISFFDLLNGGLYHSFANIQILGRNNITLYKTGMRLICSLIWYKMVITEEPQSYILYIGDKSSEKANIITCFLSSSWDDYSSYNR